MKTEDTLAIERDLEEDTTMATKLEQCSACRGFVPGSLTACPHCGVTVTRPKTTARDLARRLRLGALGGALGGGAIAFTLMACYGGAPCPDGTRDCYKSTPPTDPSGTPSATAPSTPTATDGGKP